MSHLKKSHRVAIVSCLCFIIGSVRLLHLETHWSSDETLWLTQSTQFISAVKAKARSNPISATHASNSKTISRLT